MLKVYTLEQAEKWEAVVKSFCRHDTYWLPGYLKGFRIHGDGEPRLFYYEGPDGARGINAVMLRDIHDFGPLAEHVEPGTWYDLVSPYGYGGWILEGPADPFREYEEYCAESHIVSEFVRWHPVLENHQPCGGSYDTLALGNVVTLDLSSEDAIWANMTSKNRNMIRKAEKNGVHILHGNTPELYETFRRIYNGTMDKDHAAAYYYFQPEFYESVRLDLKDHAEVFYAVKEDTIIAASIILSGNGYQNYHLSGSLREYAGMAATNLLLYKAACWGSANGSRTFYLGGGVGSGEDSLFRFKKAFYRGDDLHRFHIGRKIFLPDAYHELVKMRDMVERTDFFPEYRA